MILNGDAVLAFSGPLRCCSVHPSVASIDANIIYMGHTYPVLQANSAALSICSRGQVPKLKAPRAQAVRRRCDGV